DDIQEDTSLRQDAVDPSILKIEENQNSYRHIINDFAKSALLAMLFTILVLAAAIYILTGKLLKPLGHLTQFMSSIDDKNMRQRVVLPPCRDEVYRLTQSFNNMMDRLESSYIVQKNFAANAAHELKTPLSIMKTSLQVLELQDKPSREDYMECTNDVKQSMNRLIQTVESLTALTDSSLKDETEVIDALPVINQIKKDLTPLAEERNVKISVTGEALQLTYNKELFYRIMFNLIENAVKYNHTGGYVNIAVSSREKYIIIKDNGIGMDQQAIQNIFQPFYRSDLSRSQKIPGSGLGMSIVKTVMDRYGGTLEIESTLGKGTEIKFKI
ncbi:MAG: HAMP domain-containing sensor histidine kinase, partial [Oscillospiraceae bacterium]|nr:HAMP domain-containing sensor histidine kinase [Oscillospiraceae bacterium]